MSCQPMVSHESAIAAEKAFIMFRHLDIFVILLNERTYPTNVFTLHFIALQSD